jgi:hypothetical protein
MNIRGKPSGADVVPSKPLLLKRRTIAMGLIALAVAVTAWVLSSRPPAERQDAVALAQPTTPAQQETVPPLAVPALGVMETSPDRLEVEPVPPANNSAQTFTWPEHILRFADRADSDPVASREMEYQIQRLIDTAIDRHKFVFEPVICRGGTCVVLAKANDPQTRIKGWGLFLGPLLKDLAVTPVVNPETGVSVGRPELQAVSEHLGGAFATMIAFKTPASRGASFSLSQAEKSVAPRDAPEQPVLSGR